MNNISVFSASVICMIAILSGCTTAGLGQVESNTANQDATTASGASTDLLSALGGGLVTRLQGNGISRVDRNAALQGEYRALEYTAPGEAVLWKGDKLSGQIIPSQPYRVGSQDCRQYEHVVIDQSVRSSVKGTACRNEDGSWSLLS